MRPTRPETSARSPSSARTRKGGERNSSSKARSDARPGMRHRTSRPSRRVSLSWTLRGRLPQPLGRGARSHGGGPPVSRGRGASGRGRASMGLAGRVRHVTGEDAAPGRCFPSFGEGTCPGRSAATVRAMAPAALATTETRAAPAAPSSTPVPRHDPWRWCATCSPPTSPAPRRRCTSRGRSRAPPAWLSRSTTVPIPQGTPAILDILDGEQHQGHLLPGRGAGGKAPPPSRPRSRSGATRSPCTATATAPSRR